MATYAERVLVRDSQSRSGPTERGVYSAGNIVIWELDPTTGSTLRTIPGHFANGMTPLLSNGVMWTFSDQDNGGTEQTFAYDLNSLQILKVFQATRGSLNTAYDGAGAVCNNHFLLDYGTIFGRPGFDVYSAPGPAHLSGAVSRMTHGSARNVHDVSLPVTGASWHRMPKWRRQKKLVITRSCSRSMKRWLASLVVRTLPAGPARSAAARSIRTDGAQLHCKRISLQSRTRQFLTVALANA